jgi:hypothetical protein
MTSGSGQRIEGILPLEYLRSWRSLMAEYAFHKRKPERYGTRLNIGYRSFMLRFSKDELEFIQAAGERRGMYISALAREAAQLLIAGHVQPVKKRAITRREERLQINLGETTHSQLQAFCDSKKPRWLLTTVLRSAMLDIARMR